MSRPEGTWLGPDRRLKSARVHPISRCGRAAAAVFKAGALAAALPPTAVCPAGGGSSRRPDECSFPPWTATPCTGEERARRGRCRASGSRHRLTVAVDHDSVHDVHAQGEDAKRPPGVGTAYRQQRADRAEATADDADYP